MTAFAVSTDRVCHVARADISILFNFFVTAQRIRRVLSEALAPSGMKPDEYAVYSLLYERAPLTATEMSDSLGMPVTTLLDYLRSMSKAQHLERIPHPSDGRAVQLRLSARGATAWKRAHEYFDTVYWRFLRALDLPLDSVKAALASMDDAAESLIAEPAQAEPTESRSRHKPRRRPLVRRGQAATAKRER
jgi:DNA-binding MarR family transcriptional regulator